jgi:hypothetical protein
MSDLALQTRDQIATNYLQQMQELTHEITAAMDAIAGNAIPRFQESVARQEMLCASMAAMANTVGEGFRSSKEPTLSGIDPVIALKIRAASKAICELNLQYSALLKHSSRSIALLAMLCRSYTGQIQEARGPRLKHQTWSCEM